MLSKLTELLDSVPCAWYGFVRALSSSPGTGRFVIGLVLGMRLGSLRFAGAKFHRLFGCGLVLGLG
jgi:hypothetical protein